MDLINILPHKRSSMVTVNGTEYQIGPEGLCRGVSAADAAKMLQNKEAWREWDGKPVSTRKAQIALGAVGLITATGEVLQRASEPEPEVAKEAEPDPVALWKEPEGETEEWPDPVDSMPIEFLRHMADAHEVPYTKKTTVKDLVAKCMAAMYPDDE